MPNKSSALQNLSRGVGKFADNRYVKVISEGMMGIMPVSLVGSFAMIISQLIGMMKDPPSALQFIAKVCNAGSIVSSNLITIFVVVTLASAMAKSFKQESGPYIVVALAGFLAVTPISALLQSVEAKRPTMAIDIAYLGSKGMFVGIIVALVSTRLYALFIGKKLTIKMPDQVPAFVSKTFEQIIPVALVMLLFMLVNAAFTLTPFGNIHDFIYTYLQMPLQQLGSSVVSACLLVFVAELLWFFGIHGSAVTTSLLTALFATQSFANMEAVASGGTAEFILNSWFIETFKGPRAMALAFLLLFFCRSQHMKSIGKVAIVPSLFTITEPMKFGIPMVLNIWLLVPMSLSAVVSILIAYIASVIGFLPIVSVNISRMIPAPFNGLLACGWQGAVVQVIQFVAIVLLYIPFLRKVDNDALRKQKEAEKAVVEN